MAFYGGFTHDDSFLMGSKGTTCLTETSQELEVMSGRVSEHWHHRALEADLQGGRLEQQVLEGTEPDRL